MSNAPKTVIVDFNGNGTASVISDVPVILGTAQYTLTASVAARLKAADELEEAITNEREMVCQDMDLQAQVSKRLEEAITAYRATKEIPE